MTHGSAPVGVVPLIYSILINETLFIWQERRFLHQPLDGRPNSNRRAAYGEQRWNSYLEACLYAGRRARVREPEKGLERLHENYRGKAKDAKLICMPGQWANAEATWWSLSLPVCYSCKE